MTTGLTVVGSFDGSQILKLHSKAGNQIPNIRPIRERQPREIFDIVQQFEHDFPNARRRSTSALYNCMGLVFAARRTTISPQTITQIISEDEYDRVPRLEDTFPGDIVVYTNTDRQPRHVGIILSKIEGYGINTPTAISVLSQWGDIAEYIHDIEDVPAQFGSATHFYTDRINV